MVWGDMGIGNIWGGFALRMAIVSFGSIPERHLRDIFQYARSVPKPVFTCEALPGSPVAVFVAPFWEKALQACRQIGHPGWIAFTHKSPALSDF